MSTRYSYNELKALLHSAFRGLGLAHASEAAECVLWLECHGLGGFKQLEKDWARLNQPEQSIIRLADATPADTTIDAAQASALTVGSSCVDLAVAHAHMNTYARVVVQNCFARLFMLPYCLSAARQLSQLPVQIYERDSAQKDQQAGLYFFCHWHSDNHTHVFAVDPTTPFPRYALLTGEQRHYERSLHIMCSQSADLIDHQMQLWENKKDCSLGMLYTADALAEHRQTSVLQGILVRDADYARLQAAAARLLVPASERSRRGAGD